MGNKFPILNEAEEKLNDLAHNSAILCGKNLRKITTEGTEGEKGA